MKKKILCAALALVSALIVLSFTACGPEGFARVQDAYSRVDEASRITAEVLVLADGENVASSRTVYTRTDAGYDAEDSVTTLAPVGSDEMYETTTRTYSLTAEEMSFGALPDETAMSDLETDEREDGMVVTGVLSDDAKDELWADSDAAAGDVSVRYELSGDDFVSMTLSYVSAHGNDVTVTVSYEYR